MSNQEGLIDHSCTLLRKVFKERFEYFKRLVRETPRTTIRSQTEQRRRRCIIMMKFPTDSYLLTYIYISEPPYLSRSFQSTPPLPSVSSHVCLYKFNASQTPTQSVNVNIHCIDLIQCCIACIAIPPYIPRPFPTPPTDYPVQTEAPLQLHLKLARQRVFGPAAVLGGMCFLLPLTISRIFAAELGESIKIYLTIEFSEYFQYETGNAARRVTVIGPLRFCAGFFTFEEDR